MISEFRPGNATIHDRLLWRGRFSSYRSDNDWRLQCSNAIIKWKALCKILQFRKSCNLWKIIQIHSSYLFDICIPYIAMASSISLLIGRRKYYCSGELNRPAISEVINDIIFQKILKFTKYFTSHYRTAWIFHFSKELLNKSVKPSPSKQATVAFPGLNSDITSFCSYF